MFPNVRRVWIRQAPGIPGATVYRVKVKQSGDPYLATQPGGARPDRDYFYLIEEEERFYPFGTYTDMHYTTFSRKEDAIAWQSIVTTTPEGVHMEKIDPQKYQAVIATIGDDLLPIEAFANTLTLGIVNHRTQQVTYAMFEDKDDAQALIDALLVAYVEAFGEAFPR